MLTKNLSAVPSAKFAANPLNPQDEYQNIGDILASNKPVHVNADGTLSFENSFVKTSVPHSLSSSQSELRNISRNPDGDF